jgi:hypothetical protein
MKIKPIFASTNGDGLYAVHYDEFSSDEFSRLFEMWQDLPFLYEFFEKNQPYLLNPYFRNTHSITNVADAADKTFEYARAFEAKLKSIEKSRNISLQTYFEPLSLTVKESKSPYKYKTKERWLRLYALHIDKNVYVITGGAIKLTDTMQAHPLTNEELHKLERCKQFLLNESVFDTDSLIEFMEWEV